MIHLRPLRNAKDQALREIRNKTHEQLRREVEAPRKPKRRKPCPITYSHS